MHQFSVGGGFLPADTHTHSSCSPDAADHVSALCEAAVSLGLPALAVTDHCEANVYRAEGYDKGIRESVAAIDAAREAFAGRLELLRGVELGQATQNLAAAEECVALAPWDVVVASMHNLPGCPDFAFIEVEEKTAASLYGRYLEELVGLLEWGKFDVLAHLSYPLRYIERVHHIHVDPGPFLPALGEIFRLVVSRGKAREINTSGFRQPFGRALPDIWYLTRYRAAGGRLISFGSDAHCARDVGAGLAQGARLARGAGFTEYAMFRGRGAALHPIPCC